MVEELIGLVGPERRVCFDVACRCLREVRCAAREEWRFECSSIPGKTFDRKLKIDTSGGYATINLNNANQLARFHTRWKRSAGAVVKDSGWRLQFQPGQVAVATAVSTWSVLRRAAWTCSLLLRACACVHDWPG